MTSWPQSKSLTLRLQIRPNTLWTPAIPIGSTVDSSYCICYGGANSKPRLSPSRAPAHSQTRTRGLLELPAPSAQALTTTTAYHGANHHGFIKDEPNSVIDLHSTRFRKARATEAQVHLPAGKTEAKNLTSGIKRRLCISSSPKKGPDRES